MALYRRYRPQRFQDVIGQDHVIRPIMAALRAEKTAHAYLFSGPRGCGKTTSARILARCLNCVQAPTDTPCGECESCRELSAQGSGSLDVIELDAASHGGVEDARELVERASFAPARDRYKIFIIDEAHMVTNQGFNALLKLVEEPPEHVKFIFATTEPDKVISTIRSRTHHYPFRLVPPEILQEYLAQTAIQEGIDLGPGVLPLVVRAGGGSVRDSLSVLDQLLGGATAGRVELSEAAALLGYTDVALIDEAAVALGARDGARLFAVAENVIRQGLDPRRFVEDLLQRLRDVIVVCLAGDGARPVLASMPGDQLERLFAQAEVLGPARASQLGDLALESLNHMVGATSPRLQLELLCARLLTVEDGASTRVEAVDVSAGNRTQSTANTGGGGAPSGAMPEELRARMRASMGLGADAPKGVGHQATPAQGAVSAAAPVSSTVPTSTAPIPTDTPAVSSEPAAPRQGGDGVELAQPQASHAQPMPQEARSPHGQQQQPEPARGGQPESTGVAQPEATVTAQAQRNPAGHPAEQPERAQQSGPFAESAQHTQLVVPAGHQPQPDASQPQAEPQQAQRAAEQPAQQRQGSSIAEQAASRWPELLERANADRNVRVAFSMLKHCRVQVEGEALALVFEPNMAGLMQRFTSKGFAGVVAQFLSAQLGGELQVLAHVEGSASPKGDAAQGAASAHPAASMSGEGTGEVPSLDRLLDNLEAQVPHESHSSTAPEQPVGSAHFSTPVPAHVEESASVEAVEETAAQAEPARDASDEEDAQKNAQLQGRGSGSAHQQESAPTSVAPSSPAGDVPAPAVPAMGVPAASPMHDEQQASQGKQGGATPPIAQTMPQAPEPSFVFDQLPDIPPFPGERDQATGTSAYMQAMSSANHAYENAGNAEVSAHPNNSYLADVSQGHAPSVSEVPPFSAEPPRIPSATPQNFAQTEPYQEVGLHQEAELHREAGLHQQAEPYSWDERAHASAQQLSKQPQSLTPHTPAPTVQIASRNADIFAVEGVDLSDPSIDDSHEVGLNVVLETFGGVVIDEQVQHPQGVGQ